MSRRQRVLLSRLCCGAGCIIIESCRQVALSFALVFYKEVVGFTAIQAGALLAISLASFLLGTAVFGYLRAHVNLPYVSPKLGREKAWFLLTSFLSAFALLMSFSRCVLCEESAAASWASFAYFACALTLLGLMCGGAELAHLSLIPLVAKTQDEAIVLNAIRWRIPFSSTFLVFLISLISFFIRP